MARVYAHVEGSNERVLVRLECDECNATIKPNPRISESGWIKVVSYSEPGSDIFTQHYCPQCASRRY